MNATTVIARALLIAALAALIAACAKPEPKPEVVRPVRTMTIGANDSSALVYAGEIRARHEARLSFRASGLLLQRRVEVGSAVKQGQVLAVLDTADSRLAESAAGARLAQAESQATFAEADFKRYTELRAKNFISQAEFDRREAQLAQARQAVSAARAENERSVNQVSYGTLVAPHAGVITSIQMETGQVISAGQPVAEVAQLDEKEVAFNVPENQLDAIRSAGSIEVRLWSKPETVYRARLRELSPIADTASRTYAARLSLLDRNPGLALGMTAEVKVPAPRTDTIQVPVTALFHDQGKPAVWIVDGEPPAVKLVPVTTGTVEGDSVQIVSGLSAGQRVVTAGIHTLEPGQKVRLLDRVETAQLKDGAP